MSGAERLEQVREALTQAARYAPTSAAVIATALDGCVLLTREEADHLSYILAFYTTDESPSGIRKARALLGDRP